MNSDDTRDEIGDFEDEYGLAHDPADCAEVPDLWYDRWGKHQGGPCPWLDESDEGFILGTHRPHWAFAGDAQGPLFLSIRQIRRRITAYPKATVPVYVDSGGFTELHKHGRWTVSPEAFVDEVLRYQRELGTIGWVSIQDWMCEETALRATGLTIAEHQRRTVENFRTLFRMAPEVHWLPVLQGWELNDYMHHVEMYRDAGIILGDMQRVGVGSICRRKSVREPVEILRELCGVQGGLGLHAFGLGAQALRHAASYIASSDSLAWSYAARRAPEEVKGATGGRAGNHAQNDQGVAETYRDHVNSIMEGKT